MENYIKSGLVSTLAQLSDEKTPLHAQRGGVSPPLPLDLLAIAKEMTRKARLERDIRVANGGNWWHSVIPVEVLPLGFITCPQSLTTPLDPSRFVPLSSSESFYAQFDNSAEYKANGQILKRVVRVAARKHSMTSSEKNSFLDAQSKDNSQRIGFKIRTYKSGEVTGGQFLTGTHSKLIPAPRSGALITNKFTRAGSIKIRRSVQCSPTPLNKFCTLTFAPDLVADENKNANGSIKHKWAKQELMRFLNTCSVKQKRLKRTLNYLWTAELQENTRNIHFHILWDQFFDIKWLSKIWGQASNSVDIEKMNNPIHAANYMRKCTDYMTKDKSPIEGNRYFINQSLRESMKPVEKIIFEMTATEATYAKTVVEQLRHSLYSYQSYIEQKGGRILDFGFSIPPGRSSQTYKDKNGEMQTTRGVDPRLGKWVKSILHDSAKECSLQIAPF